MRYQLNHHGELPTFDPVKGYRILYLFGGTSPMCPSCAEWELSDHPDDHELTSKRLNEGVNTYCGTCDEPIHNQTEASQ